MQRFTELCSNRRFVEIKIGIGDSRLPTSSFTAAQMRQAEAALRARVEAARRGRPARVLH
jgi:hypothetical protein